MLSLRHVALGAITMFVAVAAGASGDLDPSFGNGGRVSVSPAVEAVASAVALQPDGKIVLAGWADDVVPPPPPPPVPDGVATPNPDFLAVRLTANGALDPTFGSGGAVVTPIDLGDSDNDLARAVASGPDGKVILGGTAWSPSGRLDLAFVRYTSSGALDPTFAGDGIRTIDLGGYDTISGLAVQPDGKVVATGSGGPGGSLIVVRLRTDGELDPAFGSGGIVMTQLGEAAPLDEGSAVILGGGKIVVAGAADYTGPIRSKFAVVRYLADGRLDGSFGSGGIVLSRGSYLERAWALTSAPGGKIVAAGHGEGGFRVARFLPNGAPDETFGDRGVVTTSFGRVDATARGVSVRADGRIVAGGLALVAEPDNDKFGVARYNDDGALDSSFGVGGKALYDAGASRLAGGAAVLQPGASPGGSDRLVVAGQGSAGVGLADHVVAVGIDLGPLGQPPPPPRRCRVPRVVGLTLVRARTRIRAARCRVGRVRRMRSARGRGRVAAQRPRAGRLVPAGTRIDLVVSRGRKSR